jgi:hypothetical protein
MRRIALLAVVALATACGSSSGNLRVANLSPDLVAAGSGIDFCVVASGAGFTGATGVMAAQGLTGALGLIYGGDGDGSLAVSKYFAYNAGTYDVGVIPMGASTCADRLLTLTGVVLNGGTNVTVGAIGQRALTGATTGGLAMRAWTDTSSVSSTQVAARFINTGFIDVTIATTVLPAYDIVQQLTGGNSVLFSNIAYPGPGTGTQVDANGYLVADSTILTAGSLFACPFSNPVTRPPSPLCQPITLPPGFGNVAGKIASVFNVGTAVIPPAIATPPLAILCGDNEPAPTTPVPYSACLAQ